MSLDPISTPWRTPPANMVKPALGLGIAMMVGGIGLTLIFRNAEAIKAWYPIEGRLLAEELALGMGSGTIMALLLWQLIPHISHLQAIRDKLTSFLALEQIHLGYAVLFGLLAGFPEEILFRGALQPLIGIFLVALLFGALHAITTLYIFYAGLAGLLLGLLADWRGNLWAATIAHASYDACLFLLLARWAKSTTRQTLSTEL